MLNITEIQDTIKELENGKTTFETCGKLATLYTVLDHINQDDSIIKEYNDILPEYSKYVELKKQYELGTLDLNTLTNSLGRVVTEIKEFILTLYQGTDTGEERAIIEDAFNAPFLHI